MGYIFRIMLLVALPFLLIMCKKEVEKSSEKELLSFELSGLSVDAKAVVDKEKRTVTFEVPSTQDVTKLTPLIRVSAYASVSPASGVAQDFSNEVIYTITAEDGSKQAYTVSVLKLSGENSILSFKFSGLNPEVVGTIDNTDNTVDLTVPYGTDLKELLPTIEISEKAEVSPKSGDKVNFSSPVVYKVTAQDKTVRNYTVTVKVGKSSDKQITEFKFAGLNPVVIGTINEEQKTIKLMVPKGTNVSSLNPTITISENASVSPQSSAKVDFTNPVRFTVTAEDGTKSVYTVTVEVEKSSNSAIAEFKFAGLTPAVVGTIDNSGKTISLTVPYGTNVTSLVPTITIDSYAKVAPGSGSAQNFSSPVSYTVTAEDGSTTAYVVTVNVAPFQTTITSVDKTTVSAGDVITISGSFASGATAVLKGQSGDINLSVNASATTVTATIPGNIALGKYSLVVASGGTSVTYSTDISVVNPNAPVITGVNKQSLIRGLDTMILYGKNLKQTGKVPYVQIGDRLTNISVNDEGTQAQILIPENISLGVVTVSMNFGYELYTNEITVTIVENNSPAPQISSVSSTTVNFGDEMTITGSNFAASGNVVSFDYSIYGFTPEIISESSTSIRIRIPIKGTALDTYNLIVKSNGKSTTYGTKINVAYGPSTFTGLETTSLSTSSPITIKGTYLYSNDENRMIKLYIDDQRVYATINFVDLNTIKLTPNVPLEVGSHKVEIKSYLNTTLISEDITVTE